MEIHEIKNLDCRIKKNRQILAREVATLLGRDSALSNEQIQKAAEKISKKYKFHISQIQYSTERKEENLCWVFVDVGTGYSQYRANSRYEIFAKFILLVNEYRKIIRAEVKK